MLKWATNRWSVQPHGPHQTLATSVATLELKGGLLGRALEPLVRIAVRQAGARSLARLKFWVENGRPYPGARAAPAC
jgi:hypothetical protein